MGLEELSLLKASEVMGSDVPVVDKDVSLQHVLELMERAGVDRAVLVEEGRIRGVLTLRDVIFKLGTVRTKQTVPSALHASSFASEPVVTAKPEEPLSRIARLMREGGFTSIPIVDPDGRPLGVVARWQLAKILSESPAASDVSVRDYMRTPPVSVNLQARILHVRQLIFQYDLSVIPVIDEGRFVGVVGIDEVARVFLKYYELHRGEPKRITPLKYVIVADAVTLRPPKVTPDASVAEAAHKMLESGYRAVIVEDAGKPVGVITGAELAKVLAPQA